MYGVQIMSVSRTRRTVRSVGSPGYECEEDKKTVRSVGSPGYESDKDREDSEECEEHML